MSREQGFARGDLDPAFPLDDKFVALRARVDLDRYHAAVSVYWHVAAAMWREVDRKSAHRICPDMPQAIEDLIGVGLLDQKGCIPRRAYEHSIGRALAARRAAADRSARHRAGISRGVTRDEPSRDGEPVRLGTGTESVSERPVRGGGPGEGDDPLEPCLAWLARHRAGISTGSATGIALARLADQHGGTKVIDAFEQLLADNEALRDGSQFVYGARKLLNPIPDVRGSSRPAAKGMTSTEELEHAVERV